LHDYRKYFRARLVLFLYLVPKSLYLLKSDLIRVNRQGIDPVFELLTLSVTATNFVKAVLASASAIFAVDLVTYRNKTCCDAAVFTGFKGVKDG